MGKQASIQSKITHTTALHQYNAAQSSDSQFGSNFLNSHLATSEQLSSNSAMRERQMAESQKSKEKYDDIVFAFADVLMYDDEKPLGDLESLSPDKMFDMLQRIVENSGLKLTMRKTPLNYSTLVKLLIKPIRVLIINCHGYYECKRENGK